MMMDSLFSKRNLLYFALLLLAAKLWLVSGHYVMVTETPHDDKLFITQAHNLLSGNWLGPYDQLVMIKGPFYPLFIACAHWLNIPLLAAQQLLYWFAALTAVWAIYPAVRKKWLLPLLFLFLLLNPFSFNYPQIGRIFREFVYLSLGLLVFSCHLGIHVHSSISWKRAAAWSAGAGIALAAFWNTREESVWILPTLLLLMLTSLLLLRRAEPTRSATLLGLYLLPWLILLTVNYTLKSINYKHYGVFSTIELKTDEFESAYGGLLRIKSDKWRQFYPVVQDVREKAYAVSPAFNELKPYLEGAVGQNWKNLAGSDDIPAAFFIWALRDAVVYAGHGKSGADALQFYAAVGREIDQACATGKLECQPRVTSLVPSWHQEYNKLLLPTFFAVLKKAVSFREFSASTQGMTSRGLTSTMLMYETVTREKLLPNKVKVLDSYPDYHRQLNKEKVRILNNIGAAYKKMMPLLFLAGLAFFLFRLVISLRKRELRMFTAASAAALAGLCSIAFILTLLTITSYSEIQRALHSAYPMVLLFIASNVLDAFSLAAERDSQPQTEAFLG
jgi:hypothetical protein